MTAKWNEITVTTKSRYGSNVETKIRYRTVDGERVIEQKIQRNLDFYQGSVEETIAYIRREAEGVIDAQIEVYDGYESYVVRLFGWSADVPEDILKAAEKEISEAPVREAAEKEKKKERAKKELERLLKAYPDLMDN